MSQMGALKHILIDEFQDTNEVRMDTVQELIALTNSYVFTIGDPNQSIYGYERKHYDPYHYYDDFDKKFEKLFADQVKFLCKLHI